MNGSAREGTSPEQELRRDLETDPESLVLARGLLAEWAAATGVPADLWDDLVLAAYEAMANAAEHGYGGCGGVVELRACRTRDAVVVTVADHGVWRPPPEDKGSRGRGLLLIEGLCHSSTVTPTATGTTVVMRWSVAPGT